VFVIILTILKDLMKSSKPKQARRWKCVLGFVLVWVSMIGFERKPRHIWGEIH